MQAANAPTPGKTTASAAATRSGSAVTAMAMESATLSAALRNAFSADRKLPAP